MISVPQPSPPQRSEPAPSATGLASGPGGQDDRPSTAPGRRVSRRTLTIIVSVASTIVIFGIAVIAALVLGRGLDLAFIALIFGFLLFGTLGFALGFFPASLPLLSSVRGILNFLALAALAALLYLYVYPAVTNGSVAGLGGAHPPSTSVSTTRQTTVVYSLTGDGRAAITAESPVPTGDNAPPPVDTLPYEHSVQLTVERKNPGMFLLVATGGSAGDSTSDSSALACTITVDGVVVAHDEASGPNRSVFCSGTPE